MKHPLLHIALRFFTLCVMTLTSTGFTIVLGYCTMTKQPTCCCGNETAQRDDDVQAASIDAPVLPCYIQHLAGGLNGITATVFTDAVSQLPALAVMPTVACIPAHIEARTPLCAAVDDSAPPGTEIYILVNSFLI